MIINRNLEKKKKILCLTSCSLQHMQEIMYWNKYSNLIYHILKSLVQHPGFMFNEFKVYRTCIFSIWNMRRQWQVVVVLTFTLCEGPILFKASPTIAASCGIVNTATQSLSLNWRVSSPDIELPVSGCYHTSHF